MPRLRVRVPTLRLGAWCNGSIERMCIGAGHKQQSFSYYNFGKIKERVRVPQPLKRATYFEGD